MSEWPQTIHSFNYHSLRPDDRRHRRERNQWTPFIPPSIETIFTCFQFAFLPVSGSDRERSMFPSNLRTVHQRQNEENEVEEIEEEEEEDALVLRMEEMMMAEEADDRPPAGGERGDEEAEERVSFADSERFFDDDEVQISSQNSSESGSMDHNCWRGWTMATEERDAMGIGIHDFLADGDRSLLRELIKRSNATIAQSPPMPSLVEMAARRVASALSFELIESTYASLPHEQRAHRGEHLPEHLVLPILRQCFPNSSDNIRLYSCLTNCSEGPFAIGDQLFQNGAVSELFQIGYHLSAVVNDHQRFGDVCGGTAAGGGGRRGGLFDVSIRVDRCRIVSCSCSCSNSSFWCQHVVAACLQRIHRPDSVQYRAAIWDSITALKDKDLKKLAQYLINELPREYIPVAQKLIDALKDPTSTINRTHGAPDPTAGLSHAQPAVWCMDENALRDEVHKILLDFLRKSCSLSVVCEFQSLLISPPALAHEWNTLQRTFCARQPESIWNLLGMVREMLQRMDANGPALLRIITEQCLALDTMLLRWYQVSLSISGHWHLAGNPNGQRNNAQQNQSRQLSIYLLFQELTMLWRLVALNPRLCLDEQVRLRVLLQLYQRAAVSRIFNILGKCTGENNSYGQLTDIRGQRLTQQNAPFSRQHFPAFFPALQACHQFDWSALAVQRLIDGTRLSADIQQKYGRCNGKGGSAAGGSPDSPFSNIPFLGELELLELPHLLEMEQQLNRLEMNNDDVVVILSQKTSRKRRKRRKKQQKDKERRKDREARRTSDKCQNRQMNHGDEDDGMAKEGKGGGSSSENEEEQRRGRGEFGRRENGTGGMQSKTSRRQPFEDDLDTFFAEAYAADLQSNAFELRFVCCEALFCYGHFMEALQIGLQLTREMLDNQPILLAMGRRESVEQPPNGQNSGGDIDDGNCTESTTTPTLESAGGDNSTGTALTADSGAENGAGQRWTKPCSTSQLFAAQHFKQQQIHFLGARHRSVADLHRSQRWLARSFPHLIDSSRLIRESLSRTVFLVKLLLLGEDFMKHRQSLQKSVNEDHQLLLSSNFPSADKCRNWAFDLLLASLGNARGAAATKLGEMEINHMEAELFTLLHRIELSPEGIEKIRSIAQKHYNNGTEKEASPEVSVIPPFRLAHYIANALSTSQTNGGGSQMGARNLQHLVPLCQTGVLRTQADEDLGMDFALRVLKREMFISELDYPLLCESTRRQRKGMQMSLLLRNRDEPARLARVLETVLDAKIHSLYQEKDRSNVDFFLPSGHASAFSTQMFASTTVRASFSNSSPCTSPFQHQNAVNRRSASTFPDSGSKSSAKLQQERPESGPVGQPSQREAGGNPLPHPIFNAVLANGADVPGGGGMAGSNGPHRNLHIASLLIALYALGLNNVCSPSWSTRTYSTHVSWIQAQVLDIGRQALEIIRKTWRNHLTPTETASLADKASQSSDPAMVGEAALLALSVLPEANSLLPTESQKALNQCKERGTKLLEEACLAVEKAAERGGVYPEVLFRVAHHWYDDLHMAHLEDSQQSHQAVQMNPQLHNFQRFPQQPQCIVRLVMPSVALHHSQHQFLPHPPPTFASPSTATVVYSPSVPPPAPPPLQQFFGSHHHNNFNQYHVQLPPAAQLFSTSAAVPLPGIHNSQAPASSCCFIPQLQTVPPHHQSLPFGSTTGYHHHATQQLSTPPPPLMLMALPAATAATSCVPPRHLLPPPPHHYAHNNTHQQTTHQWIQKGMVKQQQQQRTDWRSIQLLKNAHRCGIAAMNGLRSTESASSKFAKNPPSSDEICWLLEVSLEIGDPDYVRLFLEKVFTCVYSPFVLLQLLRGVFKFFEHLPGALRLLASGDVCLLAPQMANSGQSKTCIQQAKSAMELHPMAGPVEELLLHAILCCFNAASHKLSYPHFSASDQEYICELALVARDIFRHIPPYHPPPHHQQHAQQQQQQHENGRRKYMDLFLEHLQEQKAFKRKNGGMAAVRSTLAQQQQLQRQQTDRTTDD
uniref:SWIM-type domain-containing protein n=1 Tax=Globodera rostochiensis TaxID=31243 RepID=A0A914HXD6_GLORO